ncbi:carbohydrate sulfotransferase 11-like [Macrobrachium nipponense]|uniref:carbohydrate sulfotransferase 11-like n=1 Tax=Macrobrachium nipponense TaxID=159736 RepID=UPI0030C7CA00
MKRKLILCVLGGCFALFCIVYERDGNLRVDSSYNLGSLKWLLADRNQSSANHTDLAANNSSWEDGWQPWFREQERRKNAVKKACESLGLSKEELLDLLMLSPDERFSHLFVDDSRKAIYCYIPKVACTNWKRVWMYLTNLTTEKNLSAIPLLTPHEYGYKMQLVKKTKGSSLELRLKTYTKLIVVRHPFHRLASAYRDKILPEGDAYFQNQVLPFVQKQRPGAHLGDIRWPEFVDYLTLGKGKKCDNHWNSFMFLCHPCALDYDVIAKVETLQEDSERFLRLVGAPVELHFPNSTRTSRRIDNILWREYEEQLSHDQLDALRKAYAKDFKLFEYK